MSINKILVAYRLSLSLKKFRTPKIVKAGLNAKWYASKLENLFMKVFCFIHFPSIKIYESLCNILRLRFAVHEITQSFLGAKNDMMVTISSALRLNSYYLPFCMIMIAVDWKRVYLVCAFLSRNERLSLITPSLNNSIFNALHQTCLWI